MEVERRRHKRLLVKYDLLCHGVNSKTSRSCIGQTINVGPGGLYFETTSGFDLGNLLQVELSIPPTSGELEFGGRISGLGKVMRICRINGSSDDNTSDAEQYGVVLEFNRPLKLSS
jgi:hypothetical protein